MACIIVCVSIIPASEPNRFSSWSTMATPSAQTKKLINRPEDVVEESIEGLVATYPTLLRRLEGLHVIVRADYAEVKDAQV